MDTVLGLAVTATNVQTVLVEGRGANGATLEHNDFAAGPLDTGVAASPHRVPVGPISMLVAGAVMFVVSVSLAVSPHLTPQRGTTATVQRQAENTAVTPAPPEAVERALEAPRPARADEPPAPAPAAPIDEPPMYQPAPAIEAIVPPAPAAPVQPINPIAPPPPVIVAPPAIPEKPRLRDRIIDKIPGLNRLGG